MPGVMIRAFLASALADLRGSISQEGLAEMAIRLTRSGSLPAATPI
jgi:hypothetical protein